MSNETIQNLFNYMVHNHNVTLLVSEMDEIARIFESEKIDLAERAFAAGRSRTSWKQFKEDNDIDKFKTL